MPTHSDEHSPSDRPKYGLALTGSDWVGLPLRVGHWPERGQLSDLNAASDSVLVWTGGTSEVRVLSRGPVESTAVAREFTRNSGMIDLLPCGTVIEQVSWSGEPSTCVAVNFPEASVRALTDAPNLGLSSERGPRYCIVDAHVVDLTQRLAANATGTEDLGAVYVQSLSIALISYVSARYGRAEQTREDDRRGFLPEQRQELVEFIERQLPSNFGLVDLAEVVAYSPDHFSRLFKRTFGVSPHKYVSSRRVERAKAMLRDPNLALSDIAIACGFSSQAHMGDVFKRQTGMTPGTYRKS